MAKQMRRYDAEVSVSGQGSGGITTASRAGAMLPRAASFWMLASLLVLLLFAASAPSPLYAIYAGMWHFSPITLTAIYAVYGLGAMIAVLTSGRLSDHLGRRPVVALALLIQLGGMIFFIAARGVGALFGGRFLQGLGTALATGAISAWLVDLQPAENRRLGSVVAGIAPLAGLAGGALGASLLIQYGPDPLHLVFWLLTGIFILALVVMTLTPDVTTRTPGWLRSMRPEVGVPPEARTMFAASTPSLVAIFALVGLYLSLGPALAFSLLHTTNRLAGGLVIASLAGAGAVAAAVMRRADPHRLLVWGSLVLLAGVGITLLAVVFGSPFGLYAGSLVAGLGFGPAFSGMINSLAPLAPPDKRSALFSAIYLVLYLGFSIPAVIAGVGVAQIGLHDTTYAYGIVVMILATITTVAVARKKEQRAA